MRAALLILLLAGCAAAQTAEALLEQADAAFREGNAEKASALARRVVAQAPNAVHAHMILGVIAAQKKDWVTSNRHFLTVVRVEPANPFGYFYLGQAKLYQQRWKEAIPYFTKALERGHPEKDRVLVELALAQNEAGQPERALASLQTAGVPSDNALAAQYHAVTAFAEGKLGRGGTAMAAMRQALQLDETNPQYWEFLIGALIKADEAPQALAEAIRAQKRFPDHPDIQYVFALASYHVTESPLSKLALRNLREADAGDPRVLLAEGLLARKLGKTEDATAAFQKAAQRGVPDARLLLGIVFKESGEYEAAERELREAERVTPENGQVSLELGKLLLARGQLEEARTRLEKALGTMPDASSVNYQLGLLYRKLGQADKADEHFRRSKQKE